MLYQRMASIRACLWASQRGSAAVACSVGKAGVQHPDSYLFTDSAILYPLSWHCCAEWKLCCIKIRYIFCADVKTGGCIANY